MAMAAALRRRPSASPQLGFQLPSHAIPTEMRPRTTPPWRVHRRVALALLSILGTFLLYRSLYIKLNHRPLPQVWDAASIYLNHSRHPQVTWGSKPDFDPWDSSRFLVGEPKEHFRDNLRNDVSYVTTWTDAGFTNEFMTYVNMIYLGLITDRVPILPPFAPFHHIAHSAGILPFSSIFDLPSLRKTLRKPILEWSEIQLPPSPSPAPPQPLGCWSAWATGNTADNEPRSSEYLTKHLNLDVSYSPIPHSTRRLPQSDGAWDWHILFWPVAGLIYPKFPTNRSPIRVANPPTFQDTPAHTSYKSGKDPQKPLFEHATFASPLGSTLPPDEHLACFDFLYFMGAGKEDYEWSRPWSPAWREVGTHLKFTKRVVALGRGYAARALGVDEDEELPPFITVHVRHGDFGASCSQAEKPEDCFAPFSAYAKRVKQVQAELWEREGIRVLDRHVIVTSDETNPSFYSQITASGYTYIDHAAERTHDKHGEWYPVIVDVVVQSLGVGFVGTEWSTVSVLSERRVGDWNVRGVLGGGGEGGVERMGVRGNGGVTRMVKWGKLGADDWDEERDGDK